MLRYNKKRRKIQIAKIAALKSTARRVREMGCKAKFSPSSRTSFSLFVCCGILASFKSKISRFAWLFWPDRWHPKFPLICGKIFTQPEIWYEFSFDNHNLLVKGKLWSLFDINVKIEVRRYWWIEEKSSSVSKSNPETEAPCLSSVFRRPFYIIKVF